MFINSKRGTDKERENIHETGKDMKGQGSAESRRRHQESRWRVGFE